ncbi:MAG: ribosome assembly RNA-binding protein YhbY [Gammaproteobacteria bacterium]|nr:ribosome assembly RNA-binding protein YhbY [Gammaproteobacteria bacterium]
MSLTPQQVKHLKTLAHNRDPIIRVGQQGVTPALIKELQQALDHHELVKVKVAGADRATRKTMMDALCEQTRATSIQRIGGVLVLYRRHPDKPLITF